VVPLKELKQAHPEMKFPGAAIFYVKKTAGPDFHACKHT
jgi:hypothetical protein